MTALSGERHANILDRGINLLVPLPTDHITAIGSSCLGNDGNLLMFEQSPYLEDPERARLRILGAIAGRAVYGDEDTRTSAMSNNAALLGGVDFLLKMGKPQATANTTYNLPDGALEACSEVSDFIRTAEGIISSTDIRFDSDMAGDIVASVAGMFVCDDMLEAYTASLGHDGTIVEERVKPRAQDAAAIVHHSVLTSATRQLIHFAMTDHRFAWYAEETASEWRTGRS
jgi:hypothetical protein